MSLPQQQKENEELPSEEKPEIETEEDVPETETPAYELGELLVKGTLNYEPGEIVAFYDGEIGREEKSMDSYTEGSFDGYVLLPRLWMSRAKGIRQGSGSDMPIHRITWQILM